MKIQVYRLKISLDDIEPEIWREVQVNGNIYLDDLHEMIQIVMGWENCHLFEFSKDGERFGIPDPDGWGEPVTKASSVKLNAVLGNKKEQMSYLYDFGDDWLHTIEVLEIMSEGAWPFCLSGKRACPPEDVGGAFGYADFLETISNPDDPEYESMIEWVGEEFESEKIDLEKINDKLKKAFC